MMSTCTIFGVLLTAFMTSLQPSEGLRCYNCAHAVVDGKEVGDPSCHSGAAKFLVECNDETEVPLPVPGRRVTGHPWRQQGLGKGASYSCAETTIDGNMSGLKLALLIRFCNVDDDDDDESLSRKAECRSGFRAELEKEKDVPVGTFAGLAEHARIKVCTCHKDECKPSERKASVSGRRAGVSSGWRSARKSFSKNYWIN